MYGTGYIFSLKFFTGWVVVGIMWIFFSLFGYIYPKGVAYFSVGLYPLWEGRYAMASTFNAIYRDITGKRRRGTVVMAQGVETPPEEYIKSKEPEEDIKGKEKIAQS
jgi:hypothetical protein